MEATKREVPGNAGNRTVPSFPADAFSRLDPSEDHVFYARDRFVSHIDATALATVEQVIGRLIVEDHPAVLDLMSGWDSHIPGNLKPREVVGLGLNGNELRRNKALTRYVLHDLNADPTLPFPDNAFDAVLNTVSVDYMVRPVEVFREVGRVLRPGGLFLVVFSNRMFPQKAVKIWRESGEDERVLLVEDFFRMAGGFDKPSVFLSKGRPRSEDDKYAHLGIPSDPVYAVYAEKKGGDPHRKSRPEIRLTYGESLSREELERRKKAVKETLCCPHCGEKLKKWAVPDNPFCCTWDNDYMYICFNDACPYYVRGWDFMYREGNRGASYRLMYNPEKDCCMPVPVPSPRALRESIVEEEDL
ncbi:MAG: class I SAM-dependent methyltransferase [Deltaproteobacteria bacterium]|nr:class I SAM-dependent methyltransferase [Deltaproteobacteria bacterium]